MDSGEFQCVPRVQLTDLRSQSHPTEDWEMASEKLTLSMCRYNVCVLELPIDVDLKVEQCFVGLESLLQLSMPGQDVSDYTALKATGDEEPGLVTLPGRHSFNYKLGSSRCDKLPAQQSKQLQTVSTSTSTHLSSNASCWTDHNHAVLDVCFRFLCRLTVPWTT